MTWRHNHYFKESPFPFQGHDLVYIGCSVGCKLLELSRELKFAWKSSRFSRGQGRGSTGGTPGSFAPPAAEQETAQQRTSGLLCGCTQCFLLCVLCNLGRESQGLEGWAGGSRGFSPSSRCDPEQLKLGLPRWKLKLHFSHSISRISTWFSIAEPGLTTPSNLGLPP